MSIGEGELPVLPNGDTATPDVLSTSISRPISGLRACMLMLGLRLRRLRNRSFGGGNRPQDPSSRQTSGSKHTGHLSGILVTLGFGLPVLTVYGMALGATLPHQYIASGRGLINAGAAHLVLLACIALLLTLGLSNKDLNRLDADFEWLLTLPASIPALYAMKIAERTLLNVFSWVLLYPPLVAMVTHGETSLLGAAQALLLSLPLFFFIAVAYVVLESAARLWLPQFLVSNLQLLTTLVGIVAMLVLAYRPQWTAPFAKVPWPVFTQAVDLAFSYRAPASHSVFWHILRYLGESVAVAALGGVALQRISLRGAVVGPGGQGKRAHGVYEPLERGGWARGMLKKELLQFSRDKRSLQLAFLLPIPMVFPMIVLSTMSSGTRLFASSHYLPLLSFGAGATVLLSVSSVLHAEGKALWLLFTLPHSLARLVVRKAALWVPLCAAYALIIFGLGLRLQSLSTELVDGMIYCLLGLVLFTLIALGLGLYGVDPNASESDRMSTRGGTQIILLVVLLAVFSYGFAGDVWARVSGLVLLAAVTYAVWEDAERMLPFMLDPELEPAPTVRLMDGLVCAFSFVVLQSLAVDLAMSQLHLEAWPARLLGFAGAAGLVAASAQTVFWRRGISDLAGRLGLGKDALAAATLRRGLWWAVPAVLIASAFVSGISTLPWLRAWGESTARERLPALVGNDGVLRLLLFVCVAPVAEELLFRGMIYRALRERISPCSSALFASGVFAVIHPGVAMVPVFLMALCAARAFERSGSLVSAVLVHAAYNLTLVVASTVL